MQVFEIFDEPLDESSVERHVKISVDISKNESTYNSNHVIVYPLSNYEILWRGGYKLS